MATASRSPALPISSQIMEPIMNLIHALSAALLASCLAVPSSPSFEALKAPNGSIPSATEDISISTGGDAEASLFDVLRAVSMSSGVEFIADSDLTSMLKSSPSGFHGDFSIPASEAWTVVEHAAIQSGFCLSALHMGESKLVAVHNREESRKMDRWKYSSVGVEELDYVALHPSFLFELNMELPNLDTRSIANQLRAFQRERSNLRVVPVGSNDLVLVGVGIEVNYIARMLLKTNERAGERVLDADDASGEDEATAEDC